MILTSLQHIYEYRKCTRFFKHAVQFLVQTGCATLPDGKYPVYGTSVYAIVARGNGKQKSQAFLEAHRKFIDIQRCFSGNEHIGWHSTANCQRIKLRYSPHRDITFFKDTPELWLPMTPDAIAVFFPEDAHAPMVGRGVIHKVVIKIAIE